MQALLSFQKFKDMLQEFLNFRIGIKIEKCPSNICIEFYLSSISEAFMVSTLLRSWKNVKSPIFQR